MASVKNNLFPGELLFTLSIMALRLSTFATSCVDGKHCCKNARFCNSEGKALLTAFLRRSNLPKPSIETASPKRWTFAEFSERGYGMLVGYARVSTQDQDLTLQLDALQASHKTANATKLESDAPRSTALVSGGSL